MAEKSLATYDALLRHEDCPFERPVVVYPLYATPSGMAGLGAAAAAEIEEDAGTDSVVEDSAGADDEGVGAEVEVKNCTGDDEAVGVEWAVVLDVTAAASAASKG